jgi:hypothetical protein
VGEGEVPEGALVDEVEVAAVVQGEAHPQVRRHHGGLLGGPHQELAAHAQVRGQRDVGHGVGPPAARRVQQQPEVLAAADRSVQPPAREVGGELVGAAGRPAHAVAAPDLDLLDRPAEHVAGEAVTDGLDLGQLGHRSGG